MKQRKRLSSAEWEVINSVWFLAAQSPLGVTVRETHEHLYPKGEKALTTVQTVMGTLTKKGFLKRKIIGRVNFYFPSASPKKILRAEVVLFVSFAFNGSAVILVKYLLDSGLLSPGDLSYVLNPGESTRRPNRTTHGISTQKKAR